MSDKTNRWNLLLHDYLIENRGIGEMREDINRYSLDSYDVGVQLRLALMDMLEPYLNKDGKIEVKGEIIANGFKPEFRSNFRVWNLHREDVSRIYMHLQRLDKLEELDFQKEDMIEHQKINYVTFDLQDKDVGLSLLFLENSNFNININVQNGKVMGVKLNVV